MNYLAHAHLSFENPQILVGNMIADYVKGKQILLYEQGIQEGIKLHRLIDEFTDKHPIVKETKYIYREAAGRYDGSFLDITFDHFLALDTKEEPPQGWLNFTIECYNIIDRNITKLPEDFVGFYQHMKAENWLYNYRYHWLIEKNFGRFAYHIKYLDNDAPVYEVFNNNYKALQKSYNTFYPELKEFARKAIQE
jgi:acyl carrier protein phosphodiesterase